LVFVRKISWSRWFC